MSLPIDRTQAWELLCQHVQSDSLRKHALCVEAAMRHFATLYGYDPTYWGMVGLLHDLDYEEHPTEHCQHVSALLKEAGFDDPFIYSVLSHGWGLCTREEPRHRMEKVIYTTDELTGFATACALVRPSKSVMDLEVSSMKKKFKQLNFAAAVKREVIQQGADLLGVPLEELMQEVILALRAVANEIGFGLTPPQ